ncbi:hypothetical protein [Yinghuangia seranimata]|uniref:hypothetical protein n=1 Tax=Yinghuangia seranimata TaxID=408067 RepID=UPI00248BD9B4|nr:hypothetical protein [Yinghuangia seranimata]MDI2125106.1 hypothetical protein [Yinghuangia seranimata]
MKRQPTDGPSAYVTRVIAAKRFVGVERLRGLVATVALALASIGLVTGALLPQVWVFLGAAVVSYAADLYLHIAEPVFMRKLGRFRLGVTVRFLFRSSLLLIVMARVGWEQSRLFDIATVMLPLLFIAQITFTGVLSVVRRRRRLPVATRNMALSRLRIADAPPQRLTHGYGRQLLHLEIIGVLGVVATLIRHNPWFAVAGLGAALAFRCALLVGLLPHLTRAMRFPSRDQVLRKIDNWLAENRPEVVLYFSGSKDSAYQANMWLGVVERLDQRVLIVLRERHTLERLGATSLPVLCVPSAVHLMNMDLASVRVALYPANVGKNIHMLREPHVKHVFIGHGDSDKLASVNPYSKVYDEVWVAGPAGRERYATARVGVRDDEIVEVGRPQLFRVRGVGEHAPAPVPTVLYAPTWEGWTDDPGNTSLTTAGVGIVKALLTSPMPVRVVYKPHPFTGTRDRKAKDAHQQITRMLEKANAKLDAADRGARQEAARAQRELDAVDALLLEEVERGRVLSADDAQRSRDSMPGSGPRPEQMTALEQARNAAYWAAAGQLRHHVVQGPYPHLYDCFNEADLLVSDISSVVADFVASGKPYALTDTGRLGHAEFFERNTAARGSYLLQPDPKPLASGVRALVELLYGERDDHMAAARADLKAYLLGPDEPDSQTRFQHAATALAARSAQRVEELLPREFEPALFPDAADEPVEDEADLAQVVRPVGHPEPYSDHFPDHFAERTAW